VPQFDQRGTGFPRVQRGRLDIGAVELPPVIIAGDFDANGAVDAADFLLLRKANGSPADLDAWRANFGASQEPAAQESGNDEGGSAPVATSTRSSVPRRPQFASAQNSASSTVDESALLGWVAEQSRSRPAARSANWSLPSAKESSVADDASSAAFDEAFAGLAAG
jgi:hypothetical protein